MIRVALDSNILIYAEVEPESEKGTRSIDLILRTARDGVIPVQVLGEYLRFIQRRVPAAFEEAVRQDAAAPTGIGDWVQFGSVSRKYRSSSTMLRHRQ